MIRVQEQAFDVAAELQALRAAHPGAGASCVFLGTVREMAAAGRISAMTLEHYPGMTEKALAAIEAEALRRWPVTGSLIIHRCGRLEPGEDIVLVIALSAHRDAAFEACRFLMDYLKTEAPFWKLEEGAGGAAQWVDAHASDDAARRRWES